MAEAPREPRVSYAVPPGGRVLIDNRTGEQSAWLPLWMYWIQIGHRHADAADAVSKKEQPLGLIKAREVTTAGGPIAGPEGNVEMIEAMVTIVASANCIDAVFGSLRQVDPWKPPGGRRKTTARSGEIVEQLKHSFDVGRKAKEWSQELAWLFQLRDSIVHHSERPRIMKVAAADAEHLVLSASEAYSLTAANARRAVDIIDAVLAECLGHPRPGSRAWAERATRVKRQMGRHPGASGPRPRIEVTQTGDRIDITATVDPPDTK